MAIFIYILSLRTPNLSRCTSFNRKNVEAFFKNLNDVINRFETGKTTVHRPTNLLATRGQRQLDQVTSADIDDLVTVSCFFVLLETAHVKWCTNRKFWRSL